MSRRRLVFGWLALVVVVSGFGVWLYTGGGAGWFGSAMDDGPAADEVSPELARHTEERLRAFADGEDADSLVLGIPALRSLLRYRSDGILPAGIRDPEVHLTDSTAVLAGTIRLRELATAEAADRLESFFGDTTGVRAEVVPDVARPATGRVRVRRLEAGGVSVPSLFIPTVLDQSGLSVDAGSPRSVVFEIPRRLSGITVRDSQLVLTRSPGAGSS